jgi:hypothetical protein
VETGPSNPHRTDPKKPPKGTEKPWGKGIIRTKVREKNKAREAK